MNAINTLYNILSNDNISKFDFRYCFVDKDKRPYTIHNTFARPNTLSDFSSLSELCDIDISELEKYQGLGVSIQASNVSAIDIDHCVNVPFDVNSINSYAKQIIEIFKDFAYIEFSFSGTGLRIFFKSTKIDNYEQIYYTKNSKNNTEYYYPEGSNRYVTITGQSIYSNPIKNLTYSQQEKLMLFLNTYMKRKVQLSTQSSENNIVDNRTIDELMKIIKYHYLTNNNFQDLWFTPAPGENSNESERDYHLVAYLYDFVTKDKQKIKLLFEESPFFKTKDWKHVNKWTKNENRYYNYLYDRISRK